MPQAVAPSDRVRFGMIGIGMQGSGLMGTSITLPGVECAAACDLYAGRHTPSREIADSPALPTTRRYQELLENKEIDCQELTLGSYRRGIWQGGTLASALCARADAGDLVIGIVDGQISHPAHANVTGRMVVLYEPEVAHSCPIGIDLGVFDPE